MTLINISASIQPTTTNTPIDSRTVVQTESDIPNIKLPHEGMFVYCVASKKIYVITGLKSASLGPFSDIDDYCVDTYKELTAGSGGGLSEADKNELLDELEDRLLNGEWGTEE